VFAAHELRATKKEQIEFGGMGKSKEAKELNARIARDSELNIMERKFLLQLQLMGKGTAYKFRRKDQDNGDEDSMSVYK
jgi:hypothetical protein